MCRIRVLINTAVEKRSGIFSDSRTNKGFTTGVFLDEIRHIMDHTSDSNKRFATLTIGNEVVPGKNR